MFVSLNVFSFVKTIFADDKRRGKVYAKREIGFKARIYPSFGRLRDRGWECLEISLACRRVRGRGVRFILRSVSDYFGNSDNDNGIRRWSRQPKKSRASVSGARKAGSKMAYPRLCGVDWKLSVDDVLYDGMRLDVPLFLSDGFRAF